jgi:dephospho-CoA kinase
MRKLGLTGSIATGKSTVLGMIRDLGVPTFSADDAVHALYQGEAVPVVEALFPGVSQNGSIDRGKLAAELVGHPERLEALERAVHPLVRKRMAAFLAEAESTDAPLAVVDIPLLYETGFDYGLDGVIVTVVDPDEQRRRAYERPGMTEAKYNAILARQLPQDEKAKRATYVIDTTGTLRETRDAVAAIVADVGDPTRTT